MTDAELVKLAGELRMQAHNWNAPDGLCARAAHAIDTTRTALEKIALLDEADGHELSARHAHEAVAIATNALGKHPSEIRAAQQDGATREAFMRYIQRENECNAGVTGRPCHSRRCGCAIELQSYIDEVRSPEQERNTK